MYALEVKNLKFGYAKDLILKDVSFSIEKGKFISIIGHNGSGKSTLLKNLKRIYTPRGGESGVESVDLNR